MIKSEDANVLDNGRVILDASEALKSVPRQRTLAEALVARALPHEQSYAAHMERLVEAHRQRASKLAK